MNLILCVLVCVATGDCDEVRAYIIDIAPYISDLRLWTRTDISSIFHRGTHTISSAINLSRVFLHAQLSMEGSTRAHAYPLNDAYPLNHKHLNIFGEFFSVGEIFPNTHGTHTLEYWHVQANNCKGCAWDGGDCADPDAAQKPAGGKCKGKCGRDILKGDGDCDETNDCEGYVAPNINEKVYDWFYWSEICGSYLSIYLSRGHVYTMALTTASGMYIRWH